MNTETNALHHALGLSEQGAAEHHDYQRSKDKLVEDLKVVVADTQQLIREAANSSAEGYAALRTRLEEKLVETRARIDQARAAAGEKARQAAECTHAYVKENPWTAVGVGAAAGVLVGLLLRRR